MSKRIRCKGSKPNGDKCKKLLFEVQGDDYKIDIICPRCGHEDTYKSEPKFLHIQSLLKTE